MMNDSDLKGTEMTIYSDLELMVMEDMINSGYNPNDPEDIDTYWYEVLGSL